MKCNFCGQDNPEGAKFCAGCGQALTPAAPAKTFCSACGQENEAGAAFCASCGARLAAVSQPAMSQPAPAAEPVAQPVAAPAAEAAKEPMPKWKKFVLLGGSICAALAFLFSVGFFFAIGATTAFSGLAEEFGDAMSKTYGLGWFMGDAVDELQAMLDLADLGGMDAVLMPMMTLVFRVLFGYLIIVGFAIAMIVIAIKGIIRFVAHFRGKDTKGIAKMTIGTYLLFVTAASLLLSMFAAKSFESFDGESGAAFMTYTAGAKAGLILGGIFVGLYIATRLAVKAKDLIKVKVIVPTAISLVGMIFVAVALATAAGPILGFSMAEEGAEASTTYGFLSFLQTIPVPSEFTSNDDAIMTLVMSMSYSIVGTAMIFAFIPLAASYLGKTLRNVMGNGAHEDTLGKAIACLVFAVLTLVLSMLTLNADLAELMEMESDAITNGPAIVMLVMSVLMLGVSIAEKVVGNMFNKQQPVQQ